MDRPPRLLIADDEDVFLQSTADLLRQEGYLVDCAMDGAEAARKLQEVAYDVLISDICMPGNPDLKVLQALPDLNRDVPIILMTGYPSAQTAIRAVNLSVLAYLVKPMEFADLLAQIRRGVAQRRIQQTLAGSARRVQGWADEMAQMAGGFGQPSRAPVPQILGAMLGRMGETLLDMKRLLELGGDEGGGTACSVQNCPRLETYHRIFQEGIEVLERTKGAFKSRNLEELRMKMEGAVGKTAL